MILKSFLYSFLKEKQKYLIKYPLKSINSVIILHLKNGKEFSVHYLVCWYATFSDYVLYDIESCGRYQRVIRI